MDAPEGEALLKFMSLTSDGAPNLDAFGFSLDGVCRVSEGCEDTGTTVMGGPMVAQNIKLRGNILQLANDQHANVSVFDMRGSLVVRKAVNAGEVDLSTLVNANGLYRVMVRQGKVNYAATWAKVK